MTLRPKESTTSSMLKAVPSCLDHNDDREKFVTISYIMIGILLCIINWTRHNRAESSGNVF
jgi:hypothetical protein